MPEEKKTGSGDAVKKESAIDELRERWGIRFLGVYCILVVSLLIYLVTVFMPVAADGTATDSLPAGGVTEQIHIFGRTVDLDLALHLIAMMAIMGGLGGATYMAYSFAKHLGTKDYDPNWTWWVIIRPFTGAAFGTVFYVVLRGLIMPQVESLNDVNMYGLMAFSGLAGMFSKQAVVWLGGVFDQMLKKFPSKGDEKDEKADRSKAPVPDDRIADPSKDKGGNGTDPHP
jgi:hypothetical protein